MDRLIAYDVQTPQLKLHQVLLEVLDFYQGENGNRLVILNSGKGDIFRVNESVLNTSVTIASGDNASCGTFDCINFWNCKPYSQRKSYDCIGDKEWVQH